MDRRSPDLPEALDDLKLVELPLLDPMPYFAAPTAAKAFADLGAEVIKIEPPRFGSAERRRGPFRDQLPDPETGGLHLYLNANKFGVTLALDDPRARELLFGLLDSADIVINPNLPAVNERLGIGWRKLIEPFPKLIVVSLTFFGAESPYRDFRGADLVATHMGGVGFETPINQVTDPSNQPPLKPAGRQADHLAGLTAAAAAMCALFHRKRTGRGQHVDVSQWLAMVSVVRPTIGVFSHESKDSPNYHRVLTRLKNGMPWLYPCKDGWVSFSALTDRFWRGTKQMMGNPPAAEDPIFETLMSRVQHADAIEAMLVAWLQELTREEAFKLAQAHHVPCFPVYSPREVAENPQYRERAFFVRHDHPAAGEVTMPGAPYLLEKTPWRLKRAAPRLGEHNQTIFVERLGLSAAQLRALQQQGIV